MTTRDEFVNKLKTRLDKLNVGIEKIEHRANSVKDDAKAKLQKRIEQLREKRDSALSKIHEVKNTSEEAWNDLKQGTENIVNSLKTAITETLAHFKKHQNDTIADKLSK